MIQPASNCIVKTRKSRRVAARKLLTDLRVQLGLFAAKVKFARQILNERRTLTNLPDYLLRDIGLTREQIHFEENRGFFDLPSSRCHMYGDQRQATKDLRRSRIVRTPKD